MRRLMTLVATLTAVSVPAATETLTDRHPADRPQQVGTAQRSTAQERDAVAITVYNQNFGLVRELRTLDLPSGTVTIEYADVASGIQPETVHIRPIGGRGLQVLEQNYQYDLLSPQKLLEKYVGRTVNVYRTNPQTGEDQVVEAEVLSVNGGTILRIADEITFNYPGRFGFPEVPENLISEPTLLWRLDAGGGDQQVEVSYLTNSMNWKSDYVMVLNEDDDEAGLTGWVTLTNQSGTSYENARLQLVAGDVRRVQQPMAYDDARGRMLQEVAVTGSVGFSESPFFEYHLYTLDRPADVMNNEQKQVTLLEAEELGVDKRFIFYGAAGHYRNQYGVVASNQKVGVFLDFENSEANGLGMPLPKGVVRVYKRDADGSQQFVGEDLIDHTPRDETLRIKMGEAFDVVGDRTQVEFNRLGSCVSESTWRIDLRNHKDEDVEVLVVEPVGGEWQILSSTHPYTRVDAGTFTFSPEVAANGESTVEYRVRVSWC